MEHAHSGSCLCGAVRFEVRGPLRDSVACHCSQCRKTSGHYWSATQCRLADLYLLEDRGLRWFRSSAAARRGFCQHCGSSLFWQMDGTSTMGIGSGTLDLTTGMKTICHIYVADKADYVEIAPGAPQWPQDRPG